MLVLFLGGVECTAGLIGTLFKLLAEHPDQRADPARPSRADPRRRRGGHPLATPLQLVGRTTSREVTLHGVTIPAGGRVVLVYGAANRDERRFADPDRFDVTRGKSAPPGLRRGHARLHRCPAGPAGGQDRAGGGAAAAGRLHAHRRRRVRYRTTPNMYVWEHLNLAFPCRHAAPGPARPRRDRAPPHRPSVVTRELETRSASRRKEHKSPTAWSR